MLLLNLKADSGQQLADLSLDSAPFTVNTFFIFDVQSNHTDLTVSVNNPTGYGWAGSEYSPRDAKVYSASFRDQHIVIIDTVTHVLSYIAVSVGFFTSGQFNGIGYSPLTQRLCMFPHIPPTSPLDTTDVLADYFQIFARTVTTQLASLIFHHRRPISPSPIEIVLDLAPEPGLPMPPTRARCIALQEVAQLFQLSELSSPRRLVGAYLFALCVVRKCLTGYNANGRCTDGHANKRSNDSSDRLLHPAMDSGQWRTHDSKDSHVVLIVY